MRQGRHGGSWTSTAHAGPVTIPGPGETDREQQEASMAGIGRKNLGQPDETLEFEHGRAQIVVIDDEECWRSELAPGWSWDVDLKPWAEGATSCPMTHREHVVSGRIRYLMDDGTELVADPGDFLFIRPGHRAWVVGEETCVLIDW
jgi:hypothetical protein